MDDNWKRDLASSIGVDSGFFKKRAFADDDFVY